MNLILTKKYQTLTSISLLFIILFCFSCKKNIDTNTGDANLPPDLVTKVTSSVSGFVTDETGSPIRSATVIVGTVTSYTDQFGYFEIKNVQVVKEAATVTVSSSNFFDGIKTYTAKEGKAAFFRITLLEKITAGTIDAATGGTVSQTNGLIISLPANAVKNAATGAAYSGTVKIAAQYIDPTSPEINKIMPGDLRGINTGGGMKLLSSYGMMAVELTGSAGELLQIADGKKSTITFPIPASISSSAPNSIPLWHFDEATGFWKEEGSATKTGNTYGGEVSHFSFWNCDVPVSYVNFECSFSILTPNARQPLAHANVRMSVPGNTVMCSYGITDSSGYVSGMVPANTQLLLEVISDYQCIGSIYSQNFSTINANISLGDIEIANNNNLHPIATITGTATNCNNNAFTNGHIFILINSQYSIAPINNGSYELSFPLCDNNPFNVNIKAVESGTVVWQQSRDTSILVHPGLNAIGNLKVCGGPSNFTISSYGYIYHPISPRVLSVIKDLVLISPNTFKIDVGDLGTTGFSAILTVDPVTNHISIAAAPGAAGAPYTQFDNELPTTNPGYIPQWSISSQCNNTYYPQGNGSFYIRYGYMQPGGWRVYEELLEIL